MRNYKQVLEHKIIYIILCWGFGYFGVHRFYDRKIFTGIIYLLTFGLLGIGVLFDFIMGLISIVKLILDNTHFSI